MSVVDLLVPSPDGNAEDGNANVSWLDAKLDSWCASRSKRPIAYSAHGAVSQFSVQCMQDDMPWLHAYRHGCETASESGDMQ